MNHIEIQQGDNVYIIKEEATGKDIQVVTVKNNAELDEVLANLGSTHLKCTHGARLVGGDYYTKELS